MKNKIREMLEEIVPRVYVQSDPDMYRQHVINALADGAEIVEVGLSHQGTHLAIRLKPQPIERAPTKSEIVEQLREVVGAFENNNCINWDEPRRLATRIERYGVKDGE